MFRLPLVSWSQIRLSAVAATIESASGLGTDAEARLELTGKDDDYRWRGLLLTKLIQNRIALLNGAVTKNDKSRQFNGYAREGNPVVNDGRE